MGKMCPAEALTRFDSLRSIEVDPLIGMWRGKSLPTGHPLDGLLERLGWYGKQIESAGRVHPLLFRRPSGRLVPLRPALMPTGIALRWPTFARSRLARLSLAALGPLLRTRQPAARLSPREFRGRRSAAIIYTGQPIIDHLRAVDDDRVIGLMERRGMSMPFFFLLERDGPL